MKYKILVYLIFIGLLVFFLALATCTRNDNHTSQPTATVRKKTEFTGSEHLLLGNPSNATSDVSNYNNYLMEKPQYAISYSRDRGIPNWVSWHVSKDWLGSAPRQDDFRSDTSLPPDWYRVSTSNYSGSGFDRGHNCPSGDRTDTEADNSATFFLTNIIPQAPNHNRDTWGNMEDYIRTIVESGQECYIIMGSYGTGGTGSNGTAQTIAGGKITVPKQIWKVVVVLPYGEDDGNRIDANTRVIAVNTPNINSVSPVWENYLTTVDAIEAATGYDLLSALPTDLQQTLESRVDIGPGK